MNIERACILFEFDNNYDDVFLIKIVDLVDNTVSYELKEKRTVEMMNRWGNRKIDYANDMLKIKLKSISINKEYIDNIMSDNYEFYEFDDYDEYEINNKLRKYIDIMYNCTLNLHRSANEDRNYIKDLLDNALDNKLMNWTNIDILESLSNNTLLRLLEFRDIKIIDTFIGEVWIYNNYNNIIGICRLRYEVCYESNK